jgi:chemotaxis protein CheZ
MHEVVAMSAALDSLDVEILKKNLKDLFNYVQRVRQEIAALNRSADDADKFATMGDQLDGIVEATKDATDTIMEAVENNNEAVGKLKETTTNADQIALLDQIQNNNNAVFEACAFQDLTGQRVTKIIKSVTYVEARVDALREIWGKEELDKIEIEAERELTEDEKILHGPQRKAVAISQDEIDKLFD